MLQLKNITKAYTTGDFTQVALDDVSVSFRDNEFVAILGPSGSGKTTMLNIIGGLDHYDSGDLVIDGVSTKDYKDRDWDTFRNNRVGFVFQSYNLIPHQTILANVELALTLSGVGKEERKTRAIEALKKVGLDEHLNKRPNQLSGGQMQRVAIARALINDPEILLADEPTGALDSKTSIQIMDLLTEIAEERLVVMVTHNPDLADEYATRIVNLSDGVITDDTDPFIPTAEDMRKTRKQIRRTSMSFLTALSLSFNNLMTKKGRTFMTAFAGSIGIIGIAAILALANGVNNYIASVEEETLSSYPLQITSTGLDITSMMVSSMDIHNDALGNSGDLSEQDSDTVTEAAVMNRMFDSVGSNDLKSFKEYIESGDSDIWNYAKDIEYEYNVTPYIYMEENDGVVQVNPDTTFSGLGFGSGVTTNTMMSSMMSTNIFEQMSGTMEMAQESYDLKAGHWPEKYNECMLVLTENGSVMDFMLYVLGLRDREVMDEMVKAFTAGDEVVTEVGDERTFKYQDFLDIEMKLVCSADFYQYDEEFGVWVDKSDDDEYMKGVVEGADDLVISGIIQPKDESTSMLGTGIIYTSALIDHLIDEASKTEIVKDQLADPAIDIFSGKPFSEEEESSEDFDMGNLFTIDEGALQAAFNFDQNSLSLNLEGLDIDFNSSSLPQPPEMDLSQFGGFDMGNSDGAGDFESSAESYKQMFTQMANALVQGFIGAWQSGQIVVDPTNPQSAISDYLNGSVAQGIIEQYAQALVSTQKQQVEAMQQAMQQQMAALQDYIKQYMQDYMTSVMSTLSSEMQSAMTTAMTRAMGQLSSSMSNAMKIDADAFKEAFKFDMSEDELSELIMSMMMPEEASFDSNIAKLDYADLNKPYEIDIFAKDFEAKQGVIDVLNTYNDRMNSSGQESKAITYTDIVGALMSSVTTIIDMISYVLIAFVSISLIVSSIMIGVITYISVLERKKEIGILRAIGASKFNVSEIFNAETVIEGLISGILGVGITVLCCIPASVIVYTLFDVPNVASLPWAAGVALILISVALSFVAGLIPARSASKRDPVEALRSE